MQKSTLQQSKLEMALGCFYQLPVNTTCSRFWRKALTEDAPRCAGNNVLPVVQLPDVLPHVGAPDARMALDIHVVTQSKQALN